MNGRRAALVVSLVCFGGAGCSIKLSIMGKRDGAQAIDCPKKDVRAVALPIRPPFKRIKVSGCGEYRVYEGTCDGERNDCDNLGLDDPSCDGSCKIELVESGTLDDPKPNSAGAEATASSDPA